ncbi:antirestriction protein [Klebsiella pneumoniae]|nr:antirestriction protein [Klebsiella pneumoniae]EKZ5551242.1 antirestriction protein [Klebsiella pneumoniae]ELQ4743776.1 antirestriction protein [Klebsiella pneumoniae]ELQ4786642.1 antirestriction protein [Klebsiella pneumoniae]HBS7054473.1 antirestriction protein [Klebsiella pneumoniae]
MRTMKVNTATRESDEQFKTDKYLRCAVTDGKARLGFIPSLFFTPLADNMAASWLRQHSDYDGGFWSYWVIPQGVGGNIAPNSIQFITAQTGYIAPEGEQRIPGNYFEGEVSADAAGIIATLMIMNRLSWQVAEMGPEYDRVCRRLVSRQDALKDYISIIHHPERHLIWQAID